MDECNFKSRAVKHTVAIKAKRLQQTIPTHIPHAASRNGYYHHSSNGEHTKACNSMSLPVFKRYKSSSTLKIKTIYEIRVLAARLWVAFESCAHAH
eukprot:4548629-Amphidinium_carterae.1